MLRRERRRESDERVGQNRGENQAESAVTSSCKKKGGEAKNFKDSGYHGNWMVPAFKPLLPHPSPTTTTTTTTANMEQRMWLQRSGTN